MLFGQGRGAGGIGLDQDLQGDGRGGQNGGRVGRGHDQWCGGAELLDDEFETASRRSARLDTTPQTSSYGPESARARWFSRF